MKTKSKILESKVHHTKYLSSLDNEHGKLAIFAAMEEHAEQVACAFAEWCSKNRWTKHESLESNSFEGIEVEKWYNTYRYSVMENPLTTAELYKQFLKEHGF